MIKPRSIRRITQIKLLYLYLFLSTSTRRSKSRVETTGGEGSRLLRLLFVEVVRLLLPVDVKHPPLLFHRRQIHLDVLYLLASRLHLGKRLVGLVSALVRALAVETRV